MPVRNRLYGRVEALYFEAGIFPIMAFLKIFLSCDNGVMGQ